MPLATLRWAEAQKELNYRRTDIYLAEYGITYFYTPTAILLYTGASIPNNQGAIPPTSPCPLPSPLPLSPFPSFPPLVLPSPSFPSYREATPLKPAKGSGEAL